MAREADQVDCDDCGATISEAARGDARYCSSACRQRAYRGRQRRATLTPERRAEIEAKLAQAISVLDTVIADRPDGVTAGSRNGETT